MSGVGSHLKVGSATLGSQPGGLCQTPLQCSHACLELETREVGQGKPAGACNPGQRARAKSLHWSGACVRAARIEGSVFITLPIPGDGRYSPRL